MNSREITFFAVLGSAIALYLYSLTDSGKAFVNSAANTIGGLFVNRGLKDNNPGNVRRSSDVWQGQLSQDSVVQAGGTWDPAFVQFDTIEHGVRALGHVLRTYVQSYNLTTVEQLIERYAPEADGNDTVGYTNEVAQALNVAPGQVIDVYGLLPDIASAMMKRETGYVGDPNDIGAWVYE